MVGPTAQPNPPQPPAYGGPWQDFAQSLVAALGLQLRLEPDRLEVLRPVAEAPPTQEPGRSWHVGLKTRRKAKPTPAEPAVEFASNSPRELLEWLAEQVASLNQLPTFAAADEPHAVHEFASKLFEAYEIDGGAIHLGGCHLEPKPVLRLSTAATNAEVRHYFFDAEGAPLAADLIDQLHLPAANEPAESRAWSDRATWATAIAAAKKNSGASEEEPVVATLVQAMHAIGQLEVTLGEESLPIHFEGWARTLAAPPAICPQSGAETYHLTALADGRIVAAEQVTNCAESGDRVLVAETVVCTTTGNRVAEVHSETCPAIGEPTLPRAFVECPKCGQRVSRKALTAEGCVGCDSLTRVALDDPRLGKVLAAAPRLASHKKWRLGVTGTAIIAETGGLLKRVLVVVDKESGELRHAARRNRFLPGWRKTAETEVR